MYTNDQMMDTNRRRSNSRTSTPRLRCRYLCWLAAHTICWCLTCESSRIGTALVENDTKLPESYNNSTTRDGGPQPSNLWGKIKVEWGITPVARSLLENHTLCSAGSFWNSSQIRKDFPCNSRVKRGIDPFGPNCKRDSLKGTI